MPTKKLDDATLAEVFDLAANLYVFLATRPSDYKIQESVLEAVDRRIAKNPILRTAKRVERLADILTIDDKATPKAKRHALSALVKAGSAPDASPDAIWFAVHSLRETTLEAPDYAAAAARGIRKIAQAHPSDWQEAYLSAGSSWNGAEKNKLAQDMGLDVMRRKMGRHPAAI